jgi:myo-inositol 2-dehydrogenase / D-chiro-inositol 1-dehydrogenase
VKTLNLGVLGLGRIGRIHLENLCTKWEGVKVLAAMNPSKEGQSFAQRFNVPMVTADADAVINHPDIDAIIVCSPTNAHADYVIKSAKAGKAIFCEKPLDLSLDNVRETLQVVKQANVPLMLAFNQRMDPNFASVKKQITDGKIGRMHTVHIISRDPEPPPVSYIKTSGGLFMDMTIHDFDMSRFIVGKEVVEVFAKGYNLIDPEIGKAGDIDTGIVVLTFEDNVTAIIENSRKAVYGYDQRLEVFGSLGMVKADNPLKSTSTYLDERGSHTPRHLDHFMERYVVSYQREMEAFVHALQKNQAMPITGDDGLKAMIIAEAANMSVKLKRSVAISEVS